ncbi:MAG TPA: hypothetical protein VFN35_32470 [Ktedonobacteraceae bacterium]|nr:hypothetical protein [Ktedonobacteraceae bacterium]
MAKTDDQMLNGTQQEKGFSPLPKTNAELIAHYISRVTNPLFLVPPIFFFVAVKTAPDLLHALLWWGIICLGLSTAPILFVRAGVRRGHYDDVHVSVRSQRTVPLLFGLACMGLVFLLLIVLHAAAALIATVTAALLALACATVITHYGKWKISLHLVGISGCVTVLCLLAGPVFLCLSPLVVLVGWARWKVQGHTLMQTLAGATLAVFLTILIFKIFGL